MKRSRMKSNILLLCLFASVLLNAVFIGVGYKFYQIRQAIGTPITAGVSSSMRAEFIEQLKSDRVEIQSARNALIKARQQVNSEINADEIDKDRLKEAFREVRLATTNLQKVLQEALLVILVNEQ
ncbi:MAG: hypothetical protein QNJ17_15945 [Desulfocapsaceae bacterium]|nr:hypothetical protein [Desulfocapsaceae bacterium]